MPDRRPTGVLLSDVVDYLDQYLRVADIPDDPNALNGLQVENHGWVDHVIAAVDASQATIDGVVHSLADEDGDEGFSGGDHGDAPLVLVHHGLFWDGNRSVTGRRYNRLRTLLTNDIALYSAHIPLDVHPEVGNNPILSRRLGLTGGGTFGPYKGIELGVWGHAPEAIRSRRALLAAVQKELGLPMAPMLIPGGSDRMQRVGIVTGAGASMIAAARDVGLDTLLTGEGPHHSYFDAMEWGVNVIYAGHYATETLGVRALAEHLGERFGIPHLFHDHPTGL